MEKKETKDTREMSKLAKEIQTKLHKGIVIFKFLKTDGKTVREARGTLFEGILKTKDLKKANGMSSPKVQVFYDLDKDAFRSFQLGTELEIIDFIKK